MSTSSIRFTHTRAARVNNLFDREYTKSFHRGTLDLAYEPPVRVAALFTAPLTLPAYPGACSRTGYGDITLMPALLSTCDRSGRRTVRVTTTH